MQEKLNCFLVKLRTVEELYEVRLTIPSNLITKI